MSVRSSELTYNKHAYNRDSKFVNLNVDSSSHAMSFLAAYTTK